MNNGNEHKCPFNNLEEAIETKRKAHESYVALSEIRQEIKAIDDLANLNNQQNAKMLSFFQVLKEADYGAKIQDLMFWREKVIEPFHESIGSTLSELSNDQKEIVKEQRTITENQIRSQSRDRYLITLVTILIGAIFGVLIKHLWS